MWVKVCDVMLAKAVESFKTATQILVTRHASVNLKMVKSRIISWWFKQIILGEDFLILLIGRRACGTRLLDQEADVVRRMRGAQEVRGSELLDIMCYVKIITTRSKHVLEEFCYCSYDLCNSAGPSPAPAPALVLGIHWALAAGTRIMSSLL